MNRLVSGLGLVSVGVLAGLFFSSPDAQRFAFATLSHMTDPINLALGFGILGVIGWHFSQDRRAIKRQSPEVVQNAYDADTWLLKKDSYHPTCEEHVIYSLDTTSVDFSRRWKADLLRLSTGQYWQFTAAMPSRVIGGTEEEALYRHNIHAAIDEIEDHVGQRNFDRYRDHHVDISGMIGTDRVVTCRYNRAMLRIDFTIHAKGHQRWLSKAKNLMERDRSACMSDINPTLFVALRLAIEAYACTGSTAWMAQVRSTSTDHAGLRHFNVNIRNELPILNSIKPGKACDAGDVVLSYRKALASGCLPVPTLDWIWIKKVSRTLWYGLMSEHYPGAVLAEGACLAIDPAPSHASISRIPAFAKAAERIVEGATS